MITRREKHALAIMSVLMLICACFDQQRINDWEVFYLVVVVLPLGLYIATDPDQIENNKNE
jgi:hypothetical protein